MKLWLGRQRDGSYMLTWLEPEHRVAVGGHFEDLYVVPGDPVGHRHICEWFVGEMLGRQLALFETAQVDLQMTDLD